MSVTLSGFADEISPDPREQLATLAAESITHLELRSAWSVNVADLTGAQLAGFRAMLADAGVAVSAIGSPIGKIPVDAPLGPELDRMRRVAATARELGTTIVRVLSLLHPARGSRRSGSARRSSTGWPRWPRSPPGRAWCWRTRTRRRSSGTLPAAAPTWITSVNSPALRATSRRGELRPVRRQAVQRGLRTCSGRTWSTCRVKDALAATGEVVPCGPGRRADPGNPGRAAGLWLRGLHVAGTAPGPGGPPRRVQRTRGLHPGRPIAAS